MEKELTTKQAMRYSRHVLLSGFDLDKQEILINSKVLILGVGGLGCAASQYLTASGVGHLTLVDDDKVELTNLQRQVLHTEKSVGTNKVDSARLALQQINSEVNITALCIRPSEKQLDELIAKQDIVLDCTDNLESRNRINQICYRQSTPLVSGAAIRMEGQILCIDPRQQSACYACVSHFFGEQNLSCVESGVMSPLVGIIGAMQALEAIKLVTHYGNPLCNRLHLYDAMQATWSEFKLPRQHDCQVCGCNAQF
ncbi:molybdopterin-synthase adenylyltransferase MoeB [Aestuariibacter salexigens]|uniref:molybdopterin-synthase adenylyltransferase MoeB n=1 Tax=Aestuariibacter salexigens TaxID=226010 RepID=UPI0004159514|nr:molybdopterin-synthase adenylyltransferase MoeB [Aestuariibacter salexigens]